MGLMELAFEKLKESSDTRAFVVLARVELEMGQLCLPTKACAFALYCPFLYTRYSI